MIQRTDFYKLIMLALRDNPAIIHYHNHIRRDNGAKSMGNYKACPVLHDLLDSFVNFRFTISINLACSLIENQDGGILQNGPCNNNSPQLPAAKARTLLADDSIITIRQWIYKFMCEGPLSGGDYFFSGGFLFSVSNIRT